MHKRLLFALLLITAMLFAACAPAAAPSAPAAEGEAAAATGGETAAAGPTQFRGIWPYVVPPAGHFNTFVSTNSMRLGIYQNLMEPPLFLYMWADDDWLPMAGASWEWVDDTTVQVKLPEGAVWSDGSVYTSQDVVDTFTIARLQGLTVWNFLDSVEAVDDTTVNFHLMEPSNTVLRYIFREMYIRPSSVYGEYAARRRIGGWRHGL